MYKYTLCFIVKDDQVLMLNRNKSPWMGCWNGVGGKLENGESPLDCVKREIQEETNVLVDDLVIVPKGIVTWNNVYFGDENGLYLFVGYLQRDFCNNYPYKTNDGILDVKKIEWVSSMDNLGMSRNIPYFLPKALATKQVLEYACKFEGNKLLEVVENPLDYQQLQNEVCNGKRNNE